MSGSGARLRERFGSSGWLEVAALAVVLAVIAAAVGVAARLGLLGTAATVSLGLLAVLVSFRWPLLALVAFAGLIPFEELGRFGGLGTISRAAAILFFVTYALPRLGRLTLGAMPLTGWLFVAWTALSMTWAIDPAVAAAQIPTLLQLFVMGVLVADVVVHRPEVVRPLLWTYSIAAAIAGAIGATTFLSAAQVERTATFQEQDAAQFAALLLPALVFGLYELAAGRHWPPLSVAIVAVCGTAILLSGTRGAWVSAAVVLVIFVLPQLRPQARVRAAGLIVLVVLATLQVPGAATFLGERVDLAISTGGAGRTDIWSIGAGIIERAPLTGVGSSNFPLAFESELNRATGSGGIAGPHSIVIGTLAELGVIGFGLLVLFLGPLVLRSGWGPNGPVVRAALASLVVAGLFLDVLSNRKQVWLLIGIAAGLGYLARRNARAAPAPAPGLARLDS